MKHNYLIPWRIQRQLNGVVLVVAALCLASGAAQAQAADETPVTLDVAPAAPAPAGTVGPRELNNFSLTGKVTREPEPVAMPQPAATRPATAESRPTEVARTPRQAAPERTARLAVVESRPKPKLDPLSRQPTLAAPPSGVAEPPSPLGTGPDFAPEPVTPNEFRPTTLAGRLSWLAWAAAMVAAAAVGAFAWQRFGSNRRHLAAGIPDNYFEAVEAPIPPAPAPAPAPAAPPLPRQAVGDGHVTTRLKPPPAAPPKPVVPMPDSLRPPAPSGGVVSTRLRPWLDLELIAERMVVTDTGAVLHFDCVVQNSGSVPARDVRIEAAMINAGDQQDREISGVFERPPAPGSPIPQVPPMSSIALKTSVEMPAEAIRAYEVAGRKLLIPVVAFNAYYSWSSGSGHSGASFLVGRGSGDDEKMAPFRIDLGSKVFPRLSQRRQPAGIRA